VLAGSKAEDNVKSKDNGNKAAPHAGSGTGGNAHISEKAQKGKSGKKKSTSKVALAVGGFEPGLIDLPLPVVQDDAAFLIMLLGLVWNAYAWDATHAPIWQPQVPSSAAKGSGAAATGVKAPAANGVPGTKEVGLQCPVVALIALVVNAGEDPNNSAHTRRRLRGSAELHGSLDGMPT
jgi:hypothetical protein